MTPGERWLSTLWPLVRSHLPPPPARIVEIGCGRFGGFVPFLRSSGYDAVGVDPEAPEGPDYRRIEFERLELPQRFDAAIASSSLHHVDDPGVVLDRLTSMMRGGGTLVVLEWDWERFDEATARWCFRRLGQDHDGNWLQRHRDRWADSGQEWQSHLRDWATRERLHSGETLIQVLDERFERRLLARGPYYFVHLTDTDEADEQAAIDTGQIQANRIDWVGTLPGSRVTSMAAATKQASFGPELFAFLTDLRANNDREWFAANRERYEEQLLEPALAFVEAFAPRLEKISPHFRADARPSGGSLFRIYRDTRFSKDKSPYKTNVGIHFRHERAKDAHAPGYYLHIGPGEVFAGGGIWHPDSQAATRIREAIVADPDRWKRATRAGAFAKRLELGGDSLKRVPSWADPEHPFADDLKRKDYFGWARLSEKDVVAPGFVDEYSRICRAAAPLMQFLCDALDVPY